MPPEPTFSRSHLSAFRSSLMATTSATTRPLPRQAARPAPPSCCHRQRHATRRQSEIRPWSASSKDDEPRPTQSPTSDSASCASSPAPSSSSPSSPLSSPPPSRPPSASASIDHDTNASPPLQSPISPVPEAGAKKDPDGTISPATIYQHYGCVARRLFHVLSASRERRNAASSHANANPAADAAQTSPSPQAPPRALDWLPPSPCAPHPTTFVGLGPTLTLDVTGDMAATTLDELPISANGELPEYQLTQEWFERVLSELREAEESKTAAAAAVTADGEDSGTNVDGDVEAEAEAEVAGQKKQLLDW